jgi:hypothetical protein
MYEKIAQMRKEWAEGDAKRDAGLTVPEGLIRHLDIPYGDDPLQKLDVYYPEGTEKPMIPIPYCEEVMTGFEYALAGLMIRNGFVEEGERMVAAIRDRYDGEKRNPWNEIECGSNYARSMASFALMPIYAGFTFDMTEGYLGFDPLTSEGRYFWSVGNTWGDFRTDGSVADFAVLGEPITLSSFGIPKNFAVKSVLADGEEVPFTLKDGRILFDAPLTLTELRISAL